MKKEIRTLSSKLEYREDHQEEYDLRGFAIVYDSMSEDLGGFKEVIKRGAVKNTENRDIKALFNHETGQVIGRTSNGSLTLRDSEQGLEVFIKLPNTTLGNDVRELVAGGYIDQMSFGFNVIDDTWEERDGGTIRSISSLDLFEVSIVSIPAYADTSIAVRKLEEHKKELDEYNKGILEIYKLKLRTLKYKLFNK